MNCRYRSRWWEIWKPRRKMWYGGIVYANGSRTEYLSCGCGCNTRKPGYGVVVRQNVEVS